jgi:hypothetical protein
MARYCALNDFNSAILASSGAWAESEVLGNVFLCKVRTNDAVLADITADTTYLPLPIGVNLDANLTITNAQRNAILTKLQDMGYTLTEIQNKMGSTLTAWQGKLNRDLLTLIATRRLKVASVDGAGNVTFSGAVVTPLDIAIVDAKVSNG